MCGSFDTARQSGSAAPRASGETRPRQSHSWCTKPRISTILCSITCQVSGWDIVVCIRFGHCNGVHVSLVNEVTSLVTEVTYAAMLESVKVTKVTN